MSTVFTPFHATLGGLLIGFAAAMLMYFNGRIAGISGIFHAGFRPGAKIWQGLFLVGLVVGTALINNWLDLDYPIRSGFPLSVLITGGLLVGFGTRMGFGCTSGHGVCGISRRSKRSVFATLVFVITAIISTTISRHYFGVY